MTQGQKNNTKETFLFILKYLFIFIYIKFFSQLQESGMSSCTEELWYNETVCLWEGLSSLAREVMVATTVKQGSSDELSSW